MNVYKFNQNGKKPNLKKGRKNKTKTTLQIPFSMLSFTNNDHIKSYRICLGKLSQMKH